MTTVYNPRTSCDVCCNGTTGEAQFDDRLRALGWATIETTHRTPLAAGVHTRKLDICPVCVELYRDVLSKLVPTLYPKPVPA